MIVPRFRRTWLSAFPKEARAAIIEVCIAVEPEIRALLPSLPQVIELTVQTGKWVIPETGEAGSSISPGHISWTINPSRPEGPAAIAKSQLRSTLFHECHHQVRGWVKFGGSPRTSFMEGVVSEGLATAFERDFGGRQPSWGEYPKDAHPWVAELMHLPLHAPYRQWMFQHPRRTPLDRIPRWHLYRRLRDCRIRPVSRRSGKNPNKRNCATGGFRPRRVGRNQLGHGWSMRSELFSAPLHDAAARSRTTEQAPHVRGHGWPSSARPSLGEHQGQSRQQEVAEIVMPGAMVFRPFLP